jgi:trehalose 6-phosphate phosphatase
LQVLTSRVDFQGFVASIARAPARVLMLDYDGTLAPFHVRPELAVPYPEVARVLEAIMEAGGTRVVVVSGRPADELPPLLRLAKRPEIWGSHGWERLLPDGRRVMEAPSAGVRKALQDAAGATEAMIPKGARLECKLASIALHWRGAPQELSTQLASEARSLWQQHAPELEILPFDGGIELRARSRNKQFAVKAVLSETGQDAVAAYLGDDRTDEDAFRAIKARGLGVLVRSEFRPTEADVWLTPPDELVDFMKHWCVEGGK